MVCLMSAVTLYLADFYPAPVAVCVAAGAKRGVPAVPAEAFFPRLFWRSVSEL
jgi:hypothetical protein